VHPAKLRVDRAEVLRSERRLSVYAPITSRAGGDVDVRFTAAGEEREFSADVAPGNSELAQIRFKESISAGQAALGTGIMQILYHGDANTRREHVRLRAAANPADLATDLIRLEGDKLKATGTISDDAEGIVRFRLYYVDASGGERLWNGRATIRDGQWSFAGRVPLEAQADGGYLSVLFTGYFEKRIRGEMTSYEILPGQTRRPTGG
jgi:hypothetical protein